MTVIAPASPTPTIERTCPGCGGIVTLSLRGDHFGARCPIMTTVTGKSGKPAKCGTWVSLTPVQSRAILAKLEKEQPPNAEKKPEPPPADPAPATGDKPRAERKPAEKPADPSRAAARSRWSLSGWRG